MRILTFIFFSFISLISYSQLILTSDPASGMNELDMIDVCQCDFVTFNLSGDMADIISIEWFIDDVSVALEELELSYEFCDSGFHYIEVIYNTIGGSSSLSATVRVSTTPDFGELLNATHIGCEGESLILPGGYIDSNNYSGFEMSESQSPSGTFQVEPDNGEIFDNECLIDTMFIDAPEGVLITSIDEINNLFINLEHTYMNDLSVTFYCPNNSSVSTHITGGGGTNLGDEGGLDYSWVNESENGTWTEATGGTFLAAGEYQSQESFEAFIGCPINGMWTIEVCDFAGADQGFVYEWGIDVNVAIDPATVFTPEPTAAYWEASEWITAESDENITIQQGIPEDNYVFVVEDNFGCTYSQEVTVSLGNLIELDLVNEVSLFCSEQVLVIEEVASQSCSQDAGTFNYCYGNFETIVWSYCPDTPGDGTMMNVLFNSGFLEYNYDYIFVYDGADDTAPLIAELNGELELLEFTASNEGGCITLVLVTDVSINCQGNGYDNINYIISCGDANLYDWSWEPAEYLANPNSPLLQITEVTNDIMVFTATITLPDFPNCPLIHDVVVNAESSLDVGNEGEASLCVGSSSESLFGFLEGTPSGEGLWFDENEEPVSGFFNPDSLGVYPFYYTFDNCNASTLVTVTVMSAPPAPTIIVNENFLITEVYAGYQWYLDGVLLDGVTSQGYNVPVDGTYSVEVFNSDGCSSFSEEVFIGENTDGVFEIERIGFSIYPNPFQTYTTLSFEDKNNFYYVALYSLDGKLVREYHSVQSQLSIAKEELAKGVYTINVQSQTTNLMKRRKLIIN